MNYALNKIDGKKKPSFWTSLKKLSPLLADEKRNIILAFLAIIITSLAGLFGPVIISHTIDTYIAKKEFQGVLVYSSVLLGIYLLSLISSYLQTIIMGGVGRRTLFHLRNKIFLKLQELPVIFFNQNKAGDLISRINNDTDKLNQFFSQALMQFIGSFFMIVGAAIFLLSLNVRLGAAALFPAILVLIITRLISGWVKNKNAQNLKTVGGMSAEIQESLNNFRVIVAFNRLDFFRQKFSEANETNYSAAVKAGIANNVFTPLYGLASSMAQLIVVAFGIYLITAGNLTLGLLVAFLLYVNSFYSPLRQLAMVWSSFQLAMAAFERISEVLDLETNLPMIESDKKEGKRGLSFKKVSFAYPDGKEVLSNINFELEGGKTYALVGPTGGGKTTTASLMARLYDPTKGEILLDGKELKSYSPEERSRKIGFILQEPFLFTGTVRDNLLYSNEEYFEYSNEQFSTLLEKENLSKLLERFNEGLETPVQSGGNSLSLGQKQLIAFMRAVLRKPEFLILDEATANIDTVTEQLLEEILDKLPASTTKVIIAHRLNTINNADEIFFINDGQITLAGSMEAAVEMLMNKDRGS